MISRFFIDRPVFAAVVALATTLAGAISLQVLPVEQYPTITPPTVQVSASYPGANAQTVADAVTAPIEQEINGVEGMIYMSSNSGDDGSMSLTVTFELGTDPDMAAVRVQNRVAIAETTLPSEVTEQGVVVEKSSTSLLLVVVLSSPDESLDQLVLSNYATLRVMDPLARVPGVGSVSLFGARDFSMRVWLDPEKLAARDLTSGDVLTALRAQNVQVAAGTLGEAPSQETSGFQYALSTKGRLQSADEFSEIILKVGADQRTLRLRDVARIELGAQSYTGFSRVNGKPSAAIGIYQLPGSNAVDVATAVRAEMDELAESFPEGLAYQTVNDTTRFVSASIEEVVTTLLMAVLLVFATVFVFLQDWRATIVPAVTIPVSLVSTFAVLLALDFSINLLTLFGMILAIGIVVDDAIVVVENTTRLIDEEDLEPRDAARKSMDQITGPVIATTLVLLAVFVPTAVLPGISGQLYQQFGVTISVATIFSTLNALTLSPALCALLLRPRERKPNALFDSFDRAIEASQRGYVSALGTALRRPALVSASFIVVLIATVVAFRGVPSGFLPMEDQAAVFVNVQLPDAAVIARTDVVMQEVERIVLATPGVEDMIAIGGRSLLSGTSQSNSATAIVALTDWSERSSAELSAEAIGNSLSQQLEGLTDARVNVFLPSSIQGVGVSGGFSLELQDRGGIGLDVLQQFTEDLTTRANADPSLTGLFSGFRSGVPQLYLDIDRTKTERLGVSLSDLFETLQVNLGSAYVNDFNLFGRTYQVRAQADADFRNEVEDLRRLKVRNQDGGMVPLGSLVRVIPTVGPSTISRYNLYTAAGVTGSPAAGVSTGEAIARVEAIADEVLSDSVGLEWTGMTYQELAAGNVATLAFTLAIVFAFLFLAAQYESFTTPFTILATVPIGLLGAMGATWLRDFDNNVYTQMGLVLLIALVAKNAILIVEFAQERHAAGVPIDEAAREAARLRFRAVLMTAISFILGVVPLVVASGAGAASRQALGTAVFGGMMLATSVGLFFIPTMYALVEKSVERIRLAAKRRTQSTQSRGQGTA